MKKNKIESQFNEAKKLTSQIETIENSESENIEDMISNCQKLNKRIIPSSVGPFFACCEIARIRALLALQNKIMEKKQPGKPKQYNSEVL